MSERGQFLVTADSTSSALTPPERAEARGPYRRGDRVCRSAGLAAATGAARALTRAGARRSSARHTSARPRSKQCLNMGHLWVLRGKPAK